MVTEMKNAFYGHINRLDMAEEGITDPEYISVETSKMEKQGEKRLKD